jgi:ferredoxin
MTAQDRPVAVTVDPERCCATGGCVLIAPAVFTTEHGTAEVLSAVDLTRHLEQIREASDCCPTEAIQLIESAPSPAGNPAGRDSSSGEADAEGGGTR